MGDKKGQARELIVWYFRQMLKRAAKGKTDWSADAEAEIAGIVDLVVEAAVEEVRRQASPTVGENPTPAISGDGWQVTDEERQGG